MNPQNGQTSLDYLNQIAPQAPKQPGFTWNLRTILLLAVVAVLVIIGIVAVSNAFSGAKKEPWQRFSAQLTATTEVVDSSSNKIKNSQLRSYNSDLKLFLANTTRDLTPFLTVVGVSIKEIPASVLADESNTEMLENLEDGRLNAKYDSTYAREMSFQLAKMLAVLQQLYATDIGPKTKEYLEKTYDDLEPIYDGISNFSASNE